MRLEGRCASMLRLLARVPRSSSPQVSALRPSLQLNALARECVARIRAEAAQLRVEVASAGAEGTCIDCGVRAAGGLIAGRQLAETCLAHLGRVRVLPSSRAPGTNVAIAVETDQPIAACLASQYAGWELTATDFFAMGSGPMRAAAGREPLFDDIGYRESAEAVVGILECSVLPPKSVFVEIAEKCGIAPAQVTLLVASTSSQAGAVQIVARSIETALHKLHELNFDLARIESGHGVAPLPPAAPDPVEAIGRTNDAILYGAEVTLWVRGDDASLQDIGQRVPSSASNDYGRPFAAIFRDYDHDFYRIDRGLFSPARITLMNLDSGRCHEFGDLRPDVLAQSFLE